MCMYWPEKWIMLSKVLRHLLTDSSSAIWNCHRYLILCFPGGVGALALEDISLLL